MRTPRDAITLMHDGETPETIRSALDELQKLKPVSEKQGAEILHLREVLVAELALVEGQGSLFS